MKNWIRNIIKEELFIAKRRETEEQEQKWTFARWKCPDEMTRGELIREELRLKYLISMKPAEVRGIDIESLVGVERCLKKLHCYGIPNDRQKSK